MKKTLWLSALVILPVAIGVPALAADTSTGFYIGGNVGQSRTSISASDIILPAGFAFTAFSSNETDVGFKLYGGYRINDNFAVELGYVDLGKFSFNGTTAPAATVSGTIKNSGVNLDAVGILPLQNNFSLFGKIGACYNETKDSLAATGGLVVTNPNPKATETDLKLGLGLQYDFTKTIGARLEWEHFRNVGDRNTTGEGNINLYSVGIVVRF